MSTQQRISETKNRSHAITHPNDWEEQKKEEQKGRLVGDILGHGQELCYNQGKNLRNSWLK